MAATLASNCSVPLTSVLLLFELTKDYRILLPLMVYDNDRISIYYSIVKCMLPVLKSALVQFGLNHTLGSLGTYCKFCTPLLAK